MNPLAIIEWAGANWKLLLFLALAAALGVQTYRLQGAAAERDQLALEKQERIRRDALRDVANLRNKERTDEEHASAARRAAAVVVRAKPAGKVRPGPAVAVAAGRQGGADCIDRGRLNAELAGWVEWHAAGLSEVLARISQRGDAALTASAREGEGVSAAYRSCRAWALNLVGDGRLRLDYALNH